MKAGKLRSRLEAYYSTEGRDDPILIEYPKGSYLPRRLPRRPPVTRRAERSLGWLRPPWRWSPWLQYWIVARQRPKPAAGGDVPSIAVLPSIDMSPGKDQEYFCDGITEELINALAKLEGIRVVARTSAFEFKGKGQDIRKIGGQLNVGAVLEGSVRRAGDKLRVTAQLNNVADGYHLWSETYDRDLKDVFAIQEDISQAIVNILRVKLATNRPRPLVKKYSDDIELYNLYLKGRHDLNTTRTERLKVALEEFEQALARDPAYAPVYAGLAEAYYWLHFRSGMSGNEALPKSKQAARKALEIDDGQAMAHSALAVVLYGYDWDWPGAGREFERALELSPNDAAIHHAYSRYLTIERRLDEALREIRRAEELDPLSLTVKQYEAVVWILRGEFDQAIDECGRIVALDPGYYVAYTVQGRALLGKGMRREAVEAFQKGWDLSDHRDANSLGGLGYSLALTGDRAGAEKVLDELLRMSKQKYVRPFFIVMVYLGLGDKDHALDWLERAYREHDIELGLTADGFPVRHLACRPQVHCPSEQNGVTVTATVIPLCRPRTGRIVGSMNNHLNSLLALTLCGLGSSHAALAQSAPVILQVDVEDFVSYI